MKRAYGITVKELSKSGSQVEALLRSDMGFRLEGLTPTQARVEAKKMFLERYGEHYYVKSCSGQGASLVLYVVAGSPPSKPEQGVVWRRPPATPRGRRR